MYTGKTVLITGTSRGVGRHLAEYFIINGAIVHGMSRTMEGPEELAWSKCDLFQPQSIIECMKNFEYHGVSFDIIINNAAFLTSQYAVKMKAEDAEAMVMIDFLAPFLISREAARISKRDGGRIINISSMAVALEPMGDSVYAACKAGLNKMSNILAKELQMFQFTVNTLAISAIETDMLKQLNREKVDKVVAGLPIPRYATMDDITNVIDFFCSPKSSYITAQTIYLGGVHA